MKLSDVASIAPWTKMDLEGMKDSTIVICDCFFSKTWNSSVTGSKIGEDGARLFYETLNNSSTLTDLNLASDWFLFVMSHFRITENTFFNICNKKTISDKKGR